jgi:hypothetical protein
MCELFLNSPVIAAFVAGLSGVVAVWLGLRRFRSERWWERKAAAYAAIIESLHILEDVEDQRIEAIRKMVQLPPQHIDDLRSKAVEARAEIRKYANLGGFVVTERTTNILDDVTDALAIPYRNGELMLNYHEERWAAVGKALAAVKIDAKNDLRT